MNRRDGRRSAPSGSRPLDSAMMPPMTTRSVASAIASTSNSMLLEKLVDQHRILSAPRRRPLVHVSSRACLRRRPFAIRGRRARNCATPPVSRLIFHPHPRYILFSCTLFSVPSAGCVNLQLSRAGPINACDPRPDRLESGDVPRILTPAPARRARLTASGAAELTRHDTSPPRRTVSV